ncbi:response regulator transcription factor [Phorcysia thermohydrogeniphila]|uniref:response regulator transcription factor n=1 Tax=Phorcysia thermohydrogeniphila TaxID=936138 RepID=UPI001402E17C|nr:response regulator transcription factor [Phorcysia thermohydrogeniphila]
MKILLIEDDKSLAEEIYEVFTDYGFDVELGTSRDDIFRRNGYSFLIFDLALLGMKGLEICQAVKKRRDIPIVVLSSVCDVNVKVKWFEMGADDFLVKPFSTRELLARCIAIMRRYREKLRNVLEFEGMILKKNEGRVIVDDKSVDLTKIELQILELLMRYQEEVLPKEFILDRVWGSRKNARTLDVYIHRLRKKLGKKGKHLKTLMNVGYILTRNV